MGAAGEHVRGPTVKVKRRGREAQESGCSERGKGADVGQRFPSLMADCKPSLRKEASSSIRSQIRTTRRIPTIQRSLFE